MARGSLIKRGKNWTIIYPIGRKQKWEKVGPRKKEAEELLAERLAEIANGTLRELKRIGFSEFADKWLDDYARVRVKESTRESYRSVIEKHLKPCF